MLSLPTPKSVPIECPICLGAKYEVSLHTGQTVCHYCRGNGSIGYTKPVEKIKSILSKKKVK